MENKDTTPKVIVPKTLEPGKIRPINELSSTKQGDYSPRVFVGGTDFGESKYDIDEATSSEFIKSGDYQYTRAEAQDNWDKAGNAVVRFAGRAATSAAELVGNVYGLGKYAIDLQMDPANRLEYLRKHGTLEGYKEATWTSIFDNEVTRALDEADAWIKSKVPQYESKEYQNAPWYKKWQYANFYANDLADAAGFAVGSMVSGAAATKLTSNLFKIAKAGQLKYIDNITDGLKSGAINELQAAKEIDKIALKIKAVDYTDELTQMMFAGASESGQEARSTKDATFKKIIDNITVNPLTGKKYREATESEIRYAEMIAEDASEASFLLNMAVVGPSSKLMMDSVFKGAKNLKKGAKSLDKSVNVKADYDVTKGVYKPDVDKAYTKIAKNIGNTLKNNSIEAIQEMYQTDVSAGVEDFYLSKYYGKSDLDAMLKATNVALEKTTSDEGLLSAMLGFLTPGVSNTLTKAATGQNPLNNLSKYSEDTKKNLAYTALLNKNKSQDTFKVLYEGAARHQHFQNQLDNAIQNADDFNTKNQMHNQIENLVLTRIQTGKVEDLNKDLEYFKSLSKEDFKEVFGTDLNEENRKTVADFVQNKINKIEELNKNWDSIETTFPNLSEANKIRLWHANNAAKDSKERAADLHNEITQLVQKNYKYNTSTDYITNPLTALNVNYAKLSAEDKASYKKNLESSDINPIDKIEISKKIEDIDKLDSRSKTYSNIFNELLNDKVQVELDNTDKNVDSTSESELIDDIELEEQQKEEEELAADPFAEAIKKGQIDAFAERIKAGEKLTSPEDKQFYKNNSEEIEARLKEFKEQLNDKDDLKLESNYPENEEEIYPRVYESDSSVNPLRTSGLASVIAQPKEVSELIEKLRSKGKDINDIIKLRAVDFNGKKSIQILAEDKILGFFNDEKYSKEAFKQIASQIPIGKTLSNKQVKALGFGIKVSGGIIATSNTPVTIGELSINKKETGNQYVIFDQGFKTEGDYKSEAQLVTLSIDALEHTLPAYTKSFGRYVLAVKDNSGNWRHIPIYPTKLKNLPSKLQDKYFNDLKSKVEELKGVKEIDKDALDAFNDEVNKDVFIALSKEEVKASGADGVQVSFDINPKGNLRVNMSFINRDKEGSKASDKSVVIKANEIGNSLDDLLQAVNSKNLGFVLTKDSFRQSIPTGTMYKVKGDEFEAYVEPQVFKGQRVTLTSDKSAIALNTVEEAKPNMSLFDESSSNIKAKKAKIEKRRQEELETTKNIGEDKLKEGRENTKKLVESLKQRYPATSVQGIIIRILEKLIDFSKYSTIIDSDYLNGRNASGQATWFGMMISQETFDGILAGKEFEVHTFIHEFIHGFTTSKISDYNIEKQGLIPGFKSKLTSKEKHAIEQLQRIFEKVKKDNPKSKEYGFTNLDEFIAEAFSNTSFQYTLKNTKAEGKKSNLFSEFLEAIGDLLFEQLERWAKRFNKEIPERSTITGILEDVLAWTEDLIDQNNKLAYIATNEEINAKYDAEYVNAVKKGEMTKEQAMQALKEVGRKDSKAYAELDALEGAKPAVTPSVSDKKAETERRRQKDRDRPARESIMYKLRNKIAGIDNPTPGNEIPTLSEAIKIAGAKLASPIKINEGEITHIVFDQEESTFRFTYKGKQFAAFYIESARGITRWEIAKLNDKTGTYQSISLDELKNINAKYGSQKNLLISLGAKDLVEDIENFEKVEYSKEDKSSSSGIIPLENTVSAEQIRLGKKYGVTYTLEDFLKQYDAELDALGKTTTTETDAKVTPKKVKESSGWKVRFNIKATTDEDYKAKAKKLSEWLDNYFGTTKRQEQKGDGYFAFKEGISSSVWKHLAGGEKGESDFTIYIGNKKDAIKFAKQVEESEIKDLITIGTMGEDTLIGNIVKGRFDSKEFKYLVPNVNILKKSLEEEGLSKNGEFVTQTKSGIKIVITDGEIIYSTDGGKTFKHYKSSIVSDTKNAVEVRNQIIEDIYGDDYTGNNAKLAALEGNESKSILDRAKENAKSNPEGPKLDNTLFKTGEEVVNALITNEEIEDVKRIVPQGIDIQTKKDLTTFFDNVIKDKKVWGYFKDKVIYLSTGAGLGTGYHEAFHAIFRYGMSSEEVKRYLALGYRDLKSKFSDKQLEDKLNELRDLYGDVPNLAELLIEEHLADEFMKYKKDKPVQVGLKSLFKRLVNMLKSLIGLSNDLDSLFGKIERGDFATRVANKNDVLSDVVYKNIPSSKDKTLTQSKSKKLINTYAARVSKIAKSWDGKSKKLSNAEILNNLLDERKQVLDTLATDYIESIEDDIKRLRLEQSLMDEYYSLQNSEARNILKKEVLKKLDLFNIVEEEDEEDYDGTDGKIEFGSKDAWMLSMEETLPKQIRQYIAFATYKTIDELTGEEVDASVDAETIYNGLSHVLANTAEDDILNKWIAYAKDNEQAKAVLDMVMSDTGMSYDSNGAITDPNKNFNDLRKIITAFKRVKVQFEHTEFNPKYDFETKKLLENKVDNYNANRNTPEKIQLNNWANSLQNIITLDRPSKDEWTARAKAAKDSFARAAKSEITDDSINIVKESVAKLGIRLSNGFIRYSIIDLKEKIGQASTEELEWKSNFDVKPIDLDIFTSAEYGLAKLLSEGKDVFGKVEGIRGRLEDIAKSNAMFDESIATSNFKGADGNTRYDIILPSYVLNESLKLKSKAYRQSLIEKYPILKNNLLINNESLMSKFKIGIISGLRDHTKNDNEGKVFGDYSEREYLSQYLGYWFAQKNKEAKFLFRQNEASNTAYVTSLPVSEYYSDKITDKAIDTVFGFFKSEYDRIGQETSKGLGNIKGYNDTKTGRAFRFTEFSNLLYSMKPAEYNQLVQDARAGLELSDEQINKIKSILRSSLAKGMSDFKKLLEDNKFAKFKGGVLTNNFLIPTNMGADASEITKQLNNLYLNDYINSFAVNQLLDGDYALSRDDKGVVTITIDGVDVEVPKQPIQIDITKRNKGAMGSGPDMGKGFHRVAYIKDINAFVKSTPENGNLTRVDEKGEGTSKINTNDAQSYNTINHVIFIAERLGRLDENIKTILRKVRRGIPINGGEQKTLQDGQVSLNPWKTVTFGREFYIKTSEALIDRHEVSYIEEKEAFNTLMDNLERLEDSGKLDRDSLIEINKQLVELYKPIPGKEYYHKILNQMDIYGIDQVVAESASKGATLSPVNTMEDGFDLSQAMQDIPNEYKRLQVETPTGKTEITSGTQLMQLIDSEQDDDVKTNIIGKNGKPLNIGELRKRYRELMAESRANSFRLAAKLITERDGNIDVTKLSNKFLKSLEASGADDQLLEIFEKNWNLLPAIDKAEQLFLAHFGKGVLSQKVPGTKVSLMSDAHFRLVVDENDKPVLNKTVKTNPNKYKEYKTRKLLHNVRDPKTGEVYSECVLSERVFSKFGLKIGDTIPKELATMLGYRIPTQDKHSMISLRVVDVLPTHLEGTGIFPQEIVYLSGADFDIDSLFIQQPSFWMNDGVPTKYGTEKTLEDKWNAYLNYILANKDIQISINAKKQFGEDLTEEEFNELTPEAKHFLYETYERQTLKEFGLPSTMKEYKEFLKTGKKIINNEINNDILDIELKLLTNDHMLKDIAYTPVTSEPLVDVADYIMELKGITNTSLDSIHSVVGKFKSFAENSAGKSGIGIAANALQAFTFLAKNNVKREGTLIKINGKEFNNFSYTNDNNKRTADLLSTILSVMTDNAKDPIAGKMGLSLELLPTYTYLISLGVSEKSAALLINLPIIQKYSDLLKENKFSIKTTYEKGLDKDGKIAKLLQQEFGMSEKESKNWTIFKLKDTYGKTEIDDLTNKNIIKQGTTDLNKDVQLELLAKFLQIEEEAQSFRELNNVIKLTKGLATNFNDVDKTLVESLYRLGINELFTPPFKQIEKNVPFNITNAVKEDSLLFTNVVIALNSIKKANGIFITESPLFKVQFEKLLNNLKDKMSKDNIADAKRSFLGFLSTRAYINTLNANRTARGLANSNITMNDELLYPELGGKTFAKELIELKNSEDKTISENTFIKWLAPTLKSASNGKLPIDLVSGKSFIKLSKDTINDIVDGFKELNQNPETFEFSVRAFNYLLVKDNLEYKNDSFVKYIAPFMFNTLSDSLNIAVSKLRSNEDLESIFGASMNELGDEFREIYASYKPNQYKGLVIKKGDKMGLKSFATTVEKSLALSNNGASLLFNVEQGAMSDTERKIENIEHMGSIFDSRKNPDTKQIEFKFPEFIVIKIEKEERLYKTKVDGMTKWETFAEYEQIEQFGYSMVSPYPKTLAELRATQAKLGTLVKTNTAEEFAEDGELVNGMDVFTTKPAKTEQPNTDAIFGLSSISGSESLEYDKKPNMSIFDEEKPTNKLQKSDKNSILGKDFGTIKAELNAKLISSNMGEQELKEYLKELKASSTIEDLEKLIQKFCNRK